MASEPPSSAPRPQQPELRVGDAERERTAEILRKAAGEGRLGYDELERRVHGAFTALTRSQLDELVIDLGPDALPAVKPAPTPAPAPRHALILSVMGETRRRGRWRVARRTTVLSVMGGSRVDLTQAELPEGTSSMLVLSVMGGSKVRVPAGLTVEVFKLGIMGGNTVDLGGDPDPPPGSSAGADRTLRIRLISVMGGSQVSRASRAKPSLSAAGDDAPPSLPAG